MTRHRKVQISAVAAIANGVIALNLVASDSALANSCQTKIVGVPCGGLSQAQLNSTCAQAEPGCTVKLAVCTRGSPICGFEPYVLCAYN
jgi:hypothetical protein